MTGSQISNGSALNWIRYVVAKRMWVVLTTLLSTEAGMAKPETSGEAHKATVKS